MVRQSNEVAYIDVDDSNEYLLQEAYYQTNGPMHAS
jgi:hypothetical protein